jgi:hypothetical protein
MSNIITRTIRRFTFPAPPSILTNKLNKQSLASFTSIIKKSLPDRPTGTPEQLSRYYAQQANQHAKAFEGIYQIDQSAIMSQVADDQARYYEALAQRENNIELQEKMFRQQQTEQARKKTDVAPQPYNPWFALSRDLQDVRHALKQRTDHLKKGLHHILPPI